MAGRHRREDPPFNRPRRACAALLSVSLVTGFFTVHQLGPTQSAIALPVVPLDTDFEDVPSNAMPIDPSLLEPAPEPTSVEQTAMREGDIDPRFQDTDDKGQPFTVPPTSSPQPTPTTALRPTERATGSSVTRSTPKPSPTPRPRPPTPPTAAQAPRPAPRTTSIPAPVSFVIIPTEIINGGLKAKAVTGVRRIASATGFNGTVIGYRASAIDKDGHPAGLGADFMVYNEGALGDKIAAYILTNRSALGVKYIIWRQRYNMGNGWQSMPDRGDTTANHFDHIHITFNP